MELISVVNQTLSLLTIAGQIIVVVLIVSFATKRSEVLNFFAKHWEVCFIRKSPAMNRASFVGFNGF